MNFVDHGDLTLDTSCNAKKKKKNVLVKIFTQRSDWKTIFFPAGSDKKEMTGGGSELSRWRHAPRTTKTNESSSLPSGETTTFAHTFTTGIENKRINARVFVALSPFLNRETQSASHFAMIIKKKGMFHVLFGCLSFRLTKFVTKGKEQKVITHRLRAPTFFSCEEQRVGVSIAL